jgi:DNA-binding CsgD family transcriptional regulator
VVAALSGEAVLARIEDGFGFTPSVVSQRQWHGVATAPAVETLISVVEGLDDGVIAFDAGGRVAYRNACARRLIDAAAHRRPLLVAIRDLQRSLMPWLDGTLTSERARAKDDPRLHSTQMTVRTETAEYRLRGSAVMRDRAGRQGCIIVITLSSRHAARHLTAGELKDRFRLTPTEIRVTWLIDGGLQSREIAAALSISVNTARRHAESVLRKLAVHSRSAVRARLRRD